MTTKKVTDILDVWRNLCAESGVALVIVRELPNLKVNGATRWLKDKAVIQLSLLYKYVDILWFTFFHEAGHILLHGKKDLFIENAQIKNDRENAADKFAENLLIPENEYQSFLSNGIFTYLSIRSFAKKIEIDPGIVAGRLQHEKIVSFNQFNELKPRLCWK